MTNRCYCPKCSDKKTCIHHEAYRRLPREDGGLALCPKLKDNSDPKFNIFYLVGIDGSKTPDPQYWKDRWECIEAATETEAIEQYCKLYHGWLRQEERKLVKVLDTAATYNDPWNWIIRKGYK